MPPEGGTTDIGTPILSPRNHKPELVALSYSTPKNITIIWQRVSQAGED